MRWLCSHMVRLVRPDGSPGDTPALLEEIGESDLVLSTENSFRAGERIAMETDGFTAWLTVVSCDAREDGYGLACDFDEDFQWSPATWTPDHLYQFQPGKKAANSG